MYQCFYDYVKPNYGENAKNKSKEFRIEIVIKREGDKLDVKWKGYDN